MDTDAIEKEGRQKAAKNLSNRNQTPEERFKNLCLKRGCAKIKAIGRRFRIMDNSGDGKLDMEEFKIGCSQIGMRDIPSYELEDLFRSFDKDGSGTIDYEEFLMAVRPKMSRKRLKMVHIAFAKMDRTGNGVITLDDVAGRYNCRSHKKFINGEKSENQLLLEWLNNFEAGDNVDGIVTLDEFRNYFSGISASIDDDAYFELMMENAWGVKSREV